MIDEISEQSFGLIGEAIMEATIAISKPGRSLFAASQILIFGSLLLVNAGAVAQPAGDNDHASPGAAQAPAPAVQLLAIKAPASEFPRSFKERLGGYRSETFSPWSLAMPTVGAGLSQLKNYPTEWQQGGEGFGKRVLSGYGQSLVDNTIAFGVATIDHEDLRYPLSTYPKKAILKRTGHVLAYTFVPSKEGGGRRFGWSRLAGSFGSGFVANTWYPAQHSDTSNALYLSSMNLVSDLAVNMLREFIRPHVEFGSTKKMHSTKKEN